jgi:hypothetical protein
MPRADVFGNELAGFMIVIEKIVAEGATAVRAALLSQPQRFFGRRT